MICWIFPVNAYVRDKPTKKKVNEVSRLVAMTTVVHWQARGREKVLQT